MASLMDRGDSYRVAYLGCAQLQHMATGLGVLQKPLRELYIKARKPGNQPALQQRQITMTSNGMRMAYKPKANYPMVEEFYAVPFILLWDAVRFVLVQSSDKKDKRPKCAFEPLDNDHSRNKDNLFLPLDKKYKFLQQQQHGAIFTCVLRRTTGVKALDLHAFMCASDDQALGIVRALNFVHSCYSDEQATETGVFGYSPFGKSTVRVAAGADLAASHFAKTPPAVRRVNEHRSVTSKSSPHHAANNKQTKHAQPHVRNVFSPVQSHTPHSNQVDAHSNQLARQSRVFHLSQEDLSGPKLQIRAGFEDFNPDLPPQDEGHYQYTDTIRNEESHHNSGNDVVKLRQKGVGHLESGQLSPHSRNARHSVHDPLSPTNSPFNYAAPRSQTQDGSTHGEAGKLGQGYSLFSGPNDGPVGNPRASDRHDNAVRPHTVSPSQNRQFIRDLQEFHTRYEHSDHTPTRGQFMRPPKSPGYLDKPPNMGKTEQSPTHQRQFEFPQNRQGESVERSTEPSQVTDNSPPPRQKPIARVPPHVKTGVRVLPDNFSIPLRSHTEDKNSKPDRPRSGLFLKSASNTDERSKAGLNEKTNNGLFQKNSSSADRPKSGLFRKSPTGTGSLPDGVQFGSPPRRSKSQFSLHSNDWVVARSPDEPRDTRNWQLGGKNKKDNYKETVQNNLNDHGVDRKMGEKLLMSKKKDAEIASVMHNLKLDYRDTPTLTPGAPGGMNFEKSLGYFP